MGNNSLLLLGWNSLCVFSGRHCVTTYIEKIKGMLHDETFYKSPIKKRIDEILQIGINGILTKEQEFKYKKK